MPNMNLNANFDWKQIGEAGAVLRLMINKKNPHISSFLEDPKSYQYEKCAPFTREIIHHCSYWISHIKTPIWKSYRLITQSDWKLRKIHLLPINVYHGLVHLDGCFLWKKKNWICWWTNLVLSVVAFKPSRAVTLQLKHSQCTTKLIFMCANQQHIYTTLH